MLTAESISKRLFQKGAKSFEKWQLNTEAVNVRSVVIIVAAMHWNFIMLILQKKNLAFLSLDLRVVGKE